MASKPLSNDEANNLMRQLGMSEASAHADKRDVSKKESISNDSNVARLLSELYRSDIGRKPPHTMSR